MTGRPGLHPARLAALVSAAVRRCRLDLSGRVVLTEAASGPYVVTPVLAALGGAERVYALARPTRYGTVAELTEQTLVLADAVGRADRIEIVTEKTPELLAEADVVTNSGHVRPIDSATVAAMRPGSAVPLMYEEWELRESDVDVLACQRRGVRVAGTNERHGHVDVFSFLGVMAVSQLLAAGVAVHGSRILLLCDNPFRPFIARGLAGCGATVKACDRLPLRLDGEYDAVVVALRPGRDLVLPAESVEVLARAAPGAVVTQFWGDIDRAACQRAGVPYWPADPPEPCHMGVLPSAVGPEPVVRLQAGGLKVGELLTRREPLGDADLQYLQPVQPRLDSGVAR